ncbi:MAG: 4-hydroxythreonine-4-phosphate dehydrogenase PdxA [Pseudomonadales bacterium]
MSKNGSEPIKLVVTPGEPAGIGPDLAIATLTQTFNAQLLVIADPELLKERSQALGADITINDWSRTRCFVKGHLNVLPVALKRRCRAGVLDSDNASYVLETLEEAVRLCESQEFHGLVTGPVNKAIINQAGIAFSGHTEWLADRTDTEKVVMMLATPGLRVALATTHLPLRQVADAITGDLLIQTLTILDGELKEKFGVEQPVISVCGLNPHAGESGHLGREEIEIITPAIEQARNQGIDARGPLPADTAFTPAMLDGVDAVLAMYHDQGLPVLKHQGFGDAVNITLGLPVIRTSVDHGTALDLAGSGSANPHSLYTAIQYAEEMAARIT